MFDFGDKFVTFPLCPDKGKRKISAVKGWNKLTKSIECDAKSRAIRLQANQLVIDVDPRNGGLESLKKLSSRASYDFLSAPVIINTNSNTGGQHYYFTKDPAMKLRKKTPHYKGIEFLSDGCYAVAVGSLRDNGAYYEYREGSKLLCDIQALPEALALVFEVDDLIVTERVESTFCDPVQKSMLSDILAKLPVTDFADYEAWLSVLFASHHATGGAGLDTFLSWSLSDARYSDQRDTIKNKWRTANSDQSNQYTINTLYYYYEQYGGKRSALLLDDIIECEEEIVDEPITPSTSNTTPSTSKACLSDEIVYEEYLSEWIYIAGIERFVNKRTEHFDSKEAFNMRFSHAFPSSPAKMVLSSGLIERAHRKDYMIGQHKHLLMHDAQVVYNTYRAPDIKQAKGDVSFFFDHLDYLFPDKQDQHMLLTFMAQTVQQLTVKLRWMLIIQSDYEGVGKSSVIGRIMGHILGDSNCSQPSNEAIHGPNNRWADSKRFVMIEELMATGRLELSNKFKPLITEDKVEINIKFVPKYTVNNYFNILAFTNHKDAMIIGDKDRRYGVIMTGVKPKGYTYYKTLIDKIDANVAALYHYFMHYKYDQSMIYKAPIMNEAKRMMINQSSSPLMHEISEMIELGYHPFRVGDFTIPIEVQRMVRGNVNLQQVTKVLMRLGYVHKDRPSYRGNRHRILSKTDSVPSEHEWVQFFNDTNMRCRPLRDAG